MRTSSYNILVNVDSKLNLFAILNGYTQAFDIINACQQRCTRGI